MRSCIYMCGFMNVTRQTLFIENAHVLWFLFLHKLYAAQRSVTAAAAEGMLCSVGWEGGGVKGRRWRKSSNGAMQFSAQCCAMRACVHLALYSTYGCKRYVCFACSVCMIQSAHTRSDVVHLYLHHHHHYHHTRSMRILTHSPKLHSLTRDVYNINMYSLTSRIHILHIYTYRVHWLRLSERFEE